jgi:hypothetical protein
VGGPFAKKGAPAMMMIPVHIIAFFLATLLLPAEVNEFTMTVHSKTVQWNNQGDVWRAVELPHDDWGIYSVAENSVTVTGDGQDRATDIARFLTIPADTDINTRSNIPTAKDHFGAPVIIQREKTNITLSQTKGAFFETPVTITWKSAAPDQPNWERAMDAALLKAKTGEFDYIINHLLSAELTERMKTKYGASLWREKFTKDELKSIPFYFSWLKNPKVTQTENEIKLCGQQGCHATFILIDGQYLLHDFGQKIDSM